MNSHEEAQKTDLSRLREVIDGGHRRYWAQRVANNGRTKGSIDLGLAVSALSMAPGQRRSVREIAAFCDCTPGAIFMIEKRALQRLKKRIFLRKDPVLRELLREVAGK